MQPFVISCTTCKARLKVSDPSIVGHILACPKCDSMVQVVPPVGWSASAAPVAAVVAASQVSSAGIEHGRPSSSSLDEMDVGSFLDPPAVASPPVPSVATVVPSAPIGPTVLAKLAENWWMLLCGFAIGIVVGLGGWIIATMASKPQDALAAGTEPAALKQTSIDHTSAKPVESPVPPAAEAVKPVESDQPNNETTSIADGSAAVDQPENASEPAEEMPQDESEAEATGVAAEPSVEEQTPPAPAEETVTADQPPANDASEVDAEPPQPSPVDPSAVNAQPQEKPEAPPLRMLSQKQVKERLTEKLPAIEFDDKVPLEQFARFVAQLSGVPVEIDPAALAAIRQSGGAPVSVKLQNASIARVLQTAASQHGLTCTLREDRVIIKQK